MRASSPKYPLMQARHQRVVRRAAGVVEAVEAQGHQAVRWPRPRGVRWRRRATRLPGREPWGGRWGHQIARTCTCIGGRRTQKKKNDIMDISHLYVPWGVIYFYTCKTELYPTDPGLSKMFIKIRYIWCVPLWLWLCLKNKCILILMISCLGWSNKVI